MDVHGNVLDPSIPINWALKCPAVPPKWGGLGASTGILAAAPIVESYSAAGCGTTVLSGGITIG